MEEHSDIGVERIILEPSLSCDLLDQFNITIHYLQMSLVTAPNDGHSTVG